MSRSKKKVENTRYYEIFNVSKTASQEEIRKAYRKLVPKMHPDKGGDPKKFQEMQNAYEVLSDPKKREVYDKYGEEGIKEGRGNEADFDPFSFFGGGFGGGNRNVKRKCKAKLVQLHITLEDAFNGKSKDVEYTRRIICPKCKGNGSANPDDVTKCSSCNGRGVKTITQRMGNMIIQNQTTCPECRGEGTVIKEKCKECKGEKTKNVKHKVHVTIDKGVPDGHRYTIKEEGDQFPDIETGDLVVEIYLDKHKDFIRKGADLLYKCEISLLQALTGLKFVITHLDGRKIVIFTKPDEIIEPLKLKTVKELGMPFFNSPFRYGNLYLDFQIVFPQNLKEDEIKKITEILKNDRLHKTTSHPKDIETYVLSEFKPNDTNTNCRGGKDTDYPENEDEEEDGNYHKTVQCANQ